MLPLLLPPLCQPHLLVDPLLPLAPPPHRLQPDDPEAAAFAARARAPEGRKSWNPVVRLVQLFPILEVVGYLAVYAFAFGLLFSYIEDWTLIDGLYYSVITGTSVGFKIKFIVFLDGRL